MAQRPAGPLPGWPDSDTISVQHHEHWQACLAGRVEHSHYVFGQATRFKNTFLY